MNKPVVEFTSKISSIKLAGWQGERGISWQLNKRYKDKESGEWKETKYLSDWDLDAIASLAAQAKEFLSERRRAARDGGAVREETAPAKSYKVEVDDIPF